MTNISMSSMIAGRNPPQNPYLFCDLGTLSADMTVTSMNPISGFFATQLKDRNGRFTKDIFTNQFYVLNKGGSFNTHLRNETVTMNTKYGFVMAVSTYPVDSPTEFMRKMPFMNFIIIKGTGYFKNKTFLKIANNNKSVPPSRTITAI